ncbi:MAG: acyltransferase [Opitutus sp.]
MTTRAAIPDIRSLTGIRFFAAAWVVLFHQREQIAALCPAFALFQPLINSGHLAVPFFFILSGFILSHVYFPTYSLNQHPRFLWLRFARLWPVHLMMLLPFLAYVGAVSIKRGYIPEAQFAFSAILPELAMVRSWYSSDLLWNMPAWSIQCEWFAYCILFPLCFLTLRPIKNPFVAAAMAMILLLTHSLIPQSTFPGLTGSILFLFCAGCAIQRLRNLWPNAPGPILTFAGITCFLFGLTTASQIAYIFSFAVIILGLSYEQGLIARLLSTRPVVYGGVISFSLYMTHYAAFKFIGEGFKNHQPTTPAQGYALVAASITVTLPVAAACQFLLEMPANRWLRRYGPSSTTPIVAPQSSIACIVAVPSPTPTRSVPFASNTPMAPIDRDDSIRD